MGTAQRKRKGSAQAWNAETPKGGAQQERHARPVKVVTPVATEAPLVLEASQQWPYTMCKWMGVACRYQRWYLFDDLCMVYSVVYWS
jgi:hypothetical protein